MKLKNTVEYTWNKKVSYENSHYSYTNETEHYKYTFNPDGTFIVALYYYHVDETNDIQETTYWTYPGTYTLSGNTDGMNCTYTT